MNEWAELVTAVAALVSAVGVVVAVFRVGRVQREVRTLNESSIGELGAAGESRRIAGIPVSERTDKEARHVAMDVMRDRGE